MEFEVKEFKRESDHYLITIKIPIDFEKGLEIFQPMFLDYFRILKRKAMARSVRVPRVSREYDDGTRIRKLAITCASYNRKSKLYDENYNMFLERVAAINDIKPSHLKYAIYCVRRDRMIKMKRFEELQQLKKEKQMVSLYTSGNKIAAIARIYNTNNYYVRKALKKHNAIE